MLEKLLDVLWIARKPSWAVRWAWEFFSDHLHTARHRRGFLRYSQHFVSIQEALTQATGATEGSVAGVLSEPMPFNERGSYGSLSLRGPLAEWGASEDLGRLCYAITRLVRPEVVVETGVGAGISSWALLLAMARNETGHLYSIDLPTPRSRALSEVGCLVPSDLRRRWSLRLGASRKVLPRLMSELGEIDVFLHDSRHSYANQKFEYAVTWPHLRRGGILISDDVRSDAFLEWLGACRCGLIMIGQAKNAPIGLARKLE